MKDGPPAASAGVVALPSYEVIIAPGSLHDAGRLVRDVVSAHRAAIITDSNVGPRYADRVTASLGRASTSTYTVPAGEAHKTRDTWASLTDRMLADGFGRDSVVVALGGGVIGDLAGFVAATFMRGVPFVQLPTTLLAMIDASVGGKTGVDTHAGKNLVGAFHQPALVLEDPEALETLPEAQLRSGMAEAVKHGAIADADYLAGIIDSLPAILGADGRDAALSARGWLIQRSVAIKAGVVTQDEREGGVRKILNFGHTLGHAIEHLSGYELLHGEAVAIGMVLESRLAERVGVAAAGTARAIEEAVRLVGLPSERPGSQSPDAIVAATHGDKKARGGVVEYALPARLGAVAGAERGWSIPVADDEVLAVLAA